VSELIPLERSEYVEFHPNQLLFRSDTPREVWEATFRTLKLASKSVQWWIGDAFAFGEKAYGEEVWQYLEASEKTLANWTSVSRRVEPSRRREALSFSHHAEVTKLEPEDQSRVLEAAEVSGWSVSRTREEASRVEQARYKGVEVAEGPGEEEERSAGIEMVVDAVICPSCGEIVEGVRPVA
jgi:hypothetical protein